LARPDLLLLAALLAIACRPAAPKDPVILSLGEEVVRRSEFERHLAGLEAQGGSRLSTEVRQALLEPWLEERVQVLEARQRGLLEAGAGLEDERRAVMRLLAECSQVAVSDEEVAAYYHGHPEAFHVPETVTLWQILVKTSNEARDVRRRLAKDRKGFEALARELSKGPEAEAGGLMGRFARGQLPVELEAVAFTLVPGTLSDIVETSLGFHVLKVEAREPAREETLPEVTARIRTLLERQKADKNVRQFVSELMAKAKVNHAAAVASSRPS
jgi:parvulin-like peptidyl-prolyl isomerase